MSEELTQDETDFDAAFAEAAKKEDKKPQAAKPQEPENEPEGEGGEEQQPEGDQGSDEAKPEPTLEEQLAAAIRERDEALHRWRSDANRQSAFTLKNNQLTEQVANLTRENGQLKTQLEELKSKKPTAPAAEEGELSDVLENAPELKAAVERRIQTAIDAVTRGLREELDAANAQLAEVGQKADRAAQQVEPLASREEKRQIEDVRAELDKLFPSWRADVASGELQKWVDTQPEQIKAMFPGKGLQDSSTVLKLFYADKGATQTAATNDKLKRAAGIAPRAATRQVAHDFDSAFSEFAAKKRR